MGASGAKPRPMGGRGHPQVLEGEIGFCGDRRSEVVQDCIRLQYNTANTANAGTIRLIH